jgi:hypothetical protein
MALATPCQTPGAVYRTRIEDNKITIQVDLGNDTLHLSEESATIIEANLHNAVELVLARFYRFYDPVTVF